MACFRLASISNLKISNNVDLKPKFFDHFSSRANIDPKIFEPISGRGTFKHLNFRAERVDPRACSGSFTSLVASFYGIAGQGNKNSYLWHVDKNRWVKGPQYHKKINKTFHYSCALALNKSSILFIGLLEVEEFWKFNNAFPNKYTVIYNFDTKLWIDQESLNYHINDIGNFEYTYLTACNIHHEKKNKRYHF